MTIDDPVQHQQFLQPSPLTFYSAKIPFKHWQLRSLLCSPSSNVLYYPTDNKVYALNTATRKREVVATLPFSPRCIGARYGWMCAGGVDNGHFAVLRVGDPDQCYGNSPTPTVDEAMGLDMEVEEDEGGDTNNINSYRRSMNVKISELGGSIVNSVTLHRPPSSKSDNDVLAVLTNNDKTVRIFHLAQNRILTTLHLNIATNHASISPDGQHLVVVGDSPKVYFYHPSSSGSCPKTPGRGIGEAGCESWILSSHPPLTAGTDALISTSFSPSSLLCAVASQDGSITIFDTRYLSSSCCPDGPSAIVKKIPSSRPRTYAGAVRSVQFSPAPWDLLVWAEHSGRICVADARSNFIKRQVVDVMLEKDDLIKAEIETIGESTGEILGETEESRYSWRRATGNADSVGSSGRRPNARSEEEEETEEDGPGTGGEDIHAFFARRYSELTEMVTRVHGSPLEWWSARPLSGGTQNRNPSSSDVVHLPPFSPLNVFRSPLAPQVNATSSNPAQLVTSSVSSTPALLRDYRERQLERERARQRIHDPPRRRNSTHPSYTDQSTSTVIHVPPPPPAPAPPPPVSTIWNSAHGDPTSSRPVEVIFADHQRNGEQLLALIAEERRRNLLRRRGGGGGAMGNTEDGGVGERDDGDGVDITGCTLNRDGSKLYVATDSGIVEYRVDLRGRKVFPCFTPR
ncbi:hypothetical protein RUND412_006555 [Rhizina undulata]